MASRAAVSRLAVRSGSSRAALVAPRFASSSTHSTPSSTPDHAGPSLAGSTSGKTTHFGFRDVPEEEKETLGMSLSAM